MIKKLALAILSWGMAKIPDKALRGMRRALEAME